MPEYVKISRDLQSEDQNEFDGHFQTGTVRYKGRTFLSPTSTAKEFKLSPKTSRAHVEAMSFVEEQSNKLLEAKMHKLIEHTSQGLEGTEQMINEISQQIQCRKQMHRLLEDSAKVDRGSLLN